MPAGFDYGQVVQLTPQEARRIYAGSATVAATMLSGERFPVGTLGTTQDGRWYRFSSCAELLVPGNWLTQTAPVTNHVGNTATVTAAGATKVTFTQGATAITQNYYKDGYLVVSVTPGAGYTYGLSGHPAVGSATANTYDLAPGESIQVALTTTSRLDLIQNPYRSLIQGPANTIAANPVGVAISAITSGGFGWVQVQGLCGVLTKGTLVIGNRAVAPTATAGAVGPETALATTSDNEVTVGVVANVAADGAWSSIDLRLLS